MPAAGSKAPRRLPAMPRSLLRLSKGVYVVFFAFVAAALLFSYRRLAFGYLASHAVAAGRGPTPFSLHVDRQEVADVVEYFADYPIGPPYKDAFGELGRRARILRDWLSVLDRTADEADRAFLGNATETIALMLFPFLEPPPGLFHSETPLSALRSSFEPGSTGIVIPVGNWGLRFAAHLIVSLRSVLGSILPIQIAYAGDGDLAPIHRVYLASLVERGPPLEFLDIAVLFDNSSVAPKTGGWATKCFAALGSHFERVILLDADAVFLQPPEELLHHGAFLRTGALFFHDRLLSQNAFADRHAWWKDQIRRPSPTMEHSRAWSEGWAEEQDSGVVVLDKRRLDVFTGLLHVCWQNSYEVREEVTWKLMYGDKETWWLGLELAGAGYEFEAHYAAIVGWEQPGDDDGGGGRPKVCSFAIAHVDEQDRLLWYNGSLLKNKRKLNMTLEYDVPTSWMINAEWQKGETDLEMRCMMGGEPRRLDPHETDVLEQAIRKAREVDVSLHIGTW